MVNVSRRSFLGGILAIAATTKISLLNNLPVIRGDGIHDDIDGLNALMSHQPFICENKEIIARSGQISGGKFLIGKPLVFKTNNFIMKNTTIVVSKDFRANTVIECHSQNNVLSNMTIDGNHNENIRFVITNKREQIDSVDGLVWSA